MIHTPAILIVILASSGSESTWVHPYRWKPFSIGGTLCRMDIVFLGSGAFGIPALEALSASGHRIVQVISQPDRPAGRGNKLTPTAVAAWAEGRGLPLIRT